MKLKNCERLSLKINLLIDMKIIANLPIRLYPCDPGSGDASRPVGIDLPVNHAYPSDDSRLKCFKSV